MPIVKNGVRQALLELAHQALAGVDGNPVALPIVVVGLSAAGSKFEIKSLPGELPGREPVPSNGLTMMDRKLIHAVSGARLTAKRIAAAAGYRHNSHLSSRLTWLCRHGYLAKSPDGYSDTGKLAAEQGPHH